ncbi:hypothetical protein vBAspABolek_22 [Aeromonas phage vB_AspA_Bolek]|nr:hypothetical protein vBAspABolek_22 [Aeromonas phage vB_AspA_Bolek]
MSNPNRSCTYPDSEGIPIVLVAEAQPDEGHCCDGCVGQGDRAQTHPGGGGAVCHQLGDCDGIIWKEAI